MPAPCARFKPGTEVTEPTRLFGRDAALQSLCAAMRAGTHTEVVAERKFGKSSLLRCAAALLKDDERLLAVYIPVNYLTCSAWTDFYAWISAHIMAVLGERRRPADLHAARAFGSMYLATPQPDGNVREIFSQLHRQNPQKILSAFQSLFSVLADAGVSTILLLDEISTALKHFDGDPEQFTYLRHIAMQSSSRSQALTVCTADRTEWQDIVSKTRGSPGLNFISNHLRVGPIAEDDARMLLQTHAAECEPPFDMPPDIYDAVLNLAQAYPFYLKVTAEKAHHQVLSTGSRDTALLAEQTYASARGHLLRYITTCTTAEKKTLLAVISSPISSQRRSTPLRRLFHRGLLRIDDDVFRPFNPLFSMACKEVL